MSELAAVAPDPALPSGSLDERASGWWAMLFLILTEAPIFAYLLFSYFYLGAQGRGDPWPDGGMPDLGLAGSDTLVLLASSLAVRWGELGMRRGQRRRVAAGLGLGTVLGIVFVAVQAKEWASKSFTLSSSPYGSLYYTITGFHMAHVVAGILILATLCLWTLLGLVGGRRQTAIKAGALYWHFVDLVWLAIFFCLYLTPRMS